MSVRLLESAVDAAILTVALLLALAALSIVAYVAYSIVRLVLWLRGTELPSFSNVVASILSFEWPFKGDQK
jgi:hypothetical protein